jgi:von Willebrand factor type D domain/PEP-CTERM motif
MPKNTIVKSRRTILSEPAAMRKSKGFQAGLVLGVISIILVVYPSFAAPITYTEEATATGSLGGVAFTNADVVFNMTGDTSNVVTTSPREIIDSNSGTVTVSVAGGAPAAFTDGGAVFYNHGTGAFPPTIGFGSGDSVYYISLASPIQYDLRTSIGPVSGSAQISRVPVFEATTAGNFILTSVNSNATFTATTSGTVVGDPHFTTYDGLHYDFQAAGAFVLTRSTVPGNSFDVQIRTRAASDGSATTIVSEVAAKLGDHRVTFDLDRASAGGSFVWVDGHPISLHADNLALSLSAGRIVRLSPEHYQVIWNTGEILDVVNAGSFLNVTASLSPTDGPGSVEGLLGSDSGWARDFQLADGTFLDPQISMSDLYGIFADTWRVTDAISLLNDVPEPNTLTLLGIGLAGLGIIRRRATSRKSYTHYDKFSK